MPKIMLPRERLLKMDETTITVELPDYSSKKKKIDYSKIEAARGILKRLKSDPVKVQRKLRSEWERKLR